MFLQTINFTEISNHASSRQVITMGTCKTKALQAYLGIFSHIRTYQDIFEYNQAYSGPCVNLTHSKPWHIENKRYIKNLGIFKTLAYSKPQYIQNPGTMKTQVIFKTLNMEHFAKIINGYNYVCKF